MLAIRWVLSLIFIVQMYLAMAVIAIGFAPFALFSRKAAVKACHVFCQWVIFSLRLLCGLKTEVRGVPPTDEVMIGAKHQSFLDIIAIYNAVPRGKFIMKRELMWTPFLGQYALRIGCVPVNRGKRGAAIAKMKADVQAGTEFPGHLIIYPQGTRVAPGVAKPYKVGTGLLYQQMKEVCIPAATNVGVFWPRHGILRKPGLAVVEFLPPIAAGMGVSEFMAEIETVIETASDRLMAEAGFVKG